MKWGFPHPSSGVTTMGARTYSTVRLSGRLHALSISTPNNHLGWLRQACIQARRNRMTTSTQTQYVGIDVSIVLEATGGLEYSAALSLKKQGYAVCVINPGRTAA